MFFINRFNKKKNQRIWVLKIKNSDILVDAALSLLGKKIKGGISSITGSEITLTNNEIKGITKVITFLENRGILFKGTTRKITSHEGGFLNFLRPLMTAGLPLKVFCYL